MAALLRAEILDLSDAAPEAARAAIRQELELDASATRRVYAACARKVWSLLVERRFDPEIRDWHALLQAVKAKVEQSDEVAAERITALADLVRESVNLAEVSPARAVAKRPRARSILQRLAIEPSFVKRRQLLEDLDIRSAHLSNVLTQLTAHDLITRRGSGKEAEFRITRLGRELVGKSATHTAPELLPDERRIGEILASSARQDIPEPPEFDFRSRIRLTHVGFQDELSWDRLRNPAMPLKGSEPSRERRPSRAQFRLVKSGRPTLVLER